MPSSVNRPARAALALAFALSAGAIPVATAAAQATGATPPDSTQHRDTTPPPKPKPPLNGLDISAWVFGDFQAQTDPTAKAANGGSVPNKFDIGRAYLTFKGPLGDRASFRVTTDIKQGGANDTYKGWFLRLKYGFLQYDYLKPTATGFSGYARIGMLHTVIIDHEENFWPRFLTQTAVEKFGYMSSADQGVVGQLSLPNKLGEVYADVVNGTGYENPENNKYKDYQARVTLTPLGASSGLFKTLTISPWVSTGGNASKFLNDPTTPVDTKLAKNRYGVFVGNRDRRVTFGADYAQRTDDVEGATPTDGITGVTGRLASGFVVVRPTEFVNPNAPQSVGVVARFDHFKPNTDVDATQDFLLGGIFWEPTRKSTLALDYQRLSPKTGGVTGPRQESWFLHWQLMF